MSAREQQIVRGAGLTPSERLLASLADRAFLRLWSYPNTYIDRRRHGKGDGKEFADLTVVFDNDVVLFSDKEIQWPDHQDQNVSWTRWYRRAVADSVKQLNGAARWLDQHQDRIFTDPACQLPFPIQWPPLSSRKVHAVAVVGGASTACRNHFSSEMGTFAVIPQLKGKAHRDSSDLLFQPFAIGDVNPDGIFVHVFDRESLDVVLRELDTTPDFIGYLRDREKLIRSGMLLIAGGEEDLLAYYVQSSSESGERSFIPYGVKFDPARDKLAVPDGEYAALRARPEYQRKLEADQTSYVWDKLIETFIEHVLAGTSVSLLGQQPDIQLAEQALRIMAAESRTYRRLLGRSIHEALLRAEDERTPRFARNILPMAGARDRHVGYVFLILAHPGDEISYDQYRQVRASMLEAYCYNLFDIRDDLEVVVGIGIDASEKVTGRPGGSEDLMAIGRPDWDEDLRRRLTEAREHFGFLSREDLQMRNVGDFEYPLDPKERVSRQQRRAVERRAKKQSRTKR